MATALLYHEAMNDEQVAFQIRIRRSVRDRLKRNADKYYRTLNAEVQAALDHWVEHLENDDGKQVLSRP